jgi:hypothetical protein
VDFELNVCDTQPSCLGGARKEFIFSGRLDNLASSYCALRALLDSCPDTASLADESCIRAIALFDNEEVTLHFTIIFYNKIKNLVTIVFLIILLLLHYLCLSFFSTCSLLSHFLASDFIVDYAQVGSDSAQGAGSPVMFQAMSRITRWLTRHTPSEGIEERTIRKSFLGNHSSPRKLPYFNQSDSPFTFNHFNSPPTADVSHFRILLYLLHIGLFKYFLLFLSSRFLISSVTWSITGILVLHLKYSLPRLEMVKMRCGHKMWFVPGHEQCQRIWRMLCTPTMPIDMKKTTNPGFTKVSSSNIMPTSGMPLIL